MHYALLIALLSSPLVILPVNSQFGTLGGGLLNSAYLQTGGLIFPNADGSGPQAESLAAAIYGVAIPPGFNQFSASENFYGGDPNLNSFGGNGRIDGANPSDLLVGTGIHINGGGHHGSYSAYINDFSVFGDFGSQSFHNNDLRSSSSSLVEIDPIAARFGVVLPNTENQATLFHPSLSGSAETYKGGAVDEGPKEFINASPVETSLRFNLPTQVTLPDSIQPTLRFNPENTNNIPLGAQNGLGRADEPSPSVDSTSPSNASPLSTSDLEKNSMDVITTAFKFADDQISKTEEMKRSFEQATAAHIASGQFTASLSTAEFDTARNPIEEADEVPPIATKHKSMHSQRQSTGFPKSKETKGFPKEAMISKSPYSYRGGNRERLQAQQSAASSGIYYPSPEKIPSPEYLKSSSEPNNDKESNYYPRQKEPNEHYNSYTFLMAPGYHKNK